MRVTESQQRLVLQDSPGCFWLFGLFFILTGGLGFIASLNSAIGEPSLAAWEIGLALLMTLAVIGAGAGFIAGSLWTVQPAES